MILVLDMSIAVSAFPTQDDVDSLGIGENSEGFENVGQERPANWPPALICGEIQCESIDRSIRSLLSAEAQIGPEVITPKPKIKPRSEPLWK